MSDIDPDIKKPDEEPKIPSDQPPETPDQSAPQTLDEAIEADAEKTLEDIQELLDQVSSLENESDEMALKDIASQLPQNQDKGVPGEPGGPGEEAVSTVPPVVDAGQSEIASRVDGEANTEGAVSPDLAALDDDLAGLLDDVDKVIVHAESDSSVSSETKIPVESEVISDHAAGALPTQEEPAIEDVSSGEPGGIATDDEEVSDAAKTGGLDSKVDEEVAVEPLTPESETTPPTEAEPSPLPEAVTPQDSTEDTVPGGMDESSDLTSEIDSLLSQVKVEQHVKPPEPKKTPDAPTPKIIPPPPATDDPNLDDLSSDINDLLASVMTQSESNENAASPESPPPEAPAPDAPAPDTPAPPVQVPKASTPTEAVDTMTQDAAPPPNTVSEALPGESESPTPSSVPEEQPVAEEPASIIGEPAPVAAESASGSDVSRKEEKPTEIKHQPNVPLTQQDIAMRALDDVMADDVSQMMVGDSEVIDGVLDGIFDEQAILVQNDENFMNDSALGGIIQSGSDKDEAGDLPGTPRSDVGDLGEMINEEIAAISPPESKKETPAPTETEVGELDQPSPSQDAPVPVVAPSVVGAATVEVTSDQPQSAPGDKENYWKIRAQAAFEIIEPPLVMVLTGINYPLRKIPKKLRPAVDWLALSLVFWVPIVWVLALFVS